MLCCNKYPFFSITLCLLAHVLFTPCTSAQPLLQEHENATYHEDTASPQPPKEAPSSLWLTRILSSDELTLFCDIPEENPLIFHWFSIGILLGLHITTLEHIFISSTTMPEHFYAMIFAWLNQKCDDNLQGHFDPKIENFLRAVYTVITPEVAINTAHFFALKLCSEKKIDNPTITARLNVLATQFLQTHLANNQCTKINDFVEKKWTPEALPFLYMQARNIGITRFVPFIQRGLKQREISLPTFSPASTSSEIIVMHHMLLRGLNAWIDTGHATLDELIYATASPIGGADPSEARAIYTNYGGEKITPYCSTPYIEKKRYASTKSKK